MIRNATVDFNQYIVDTTTVSTNVPLLMSLLSGRHITLDINLGAGTTVVTSELDLERNADRPGEDLFLDGEELKLFRVYVRGKDDSAIMLKVLQAVFCIFLCSF